MDTVERYRVLLQLDPSSQIFVALAEALCSQKEWAEAISVCRQGLTFHPQNLAGRVLLGWSLWESGELEEGERILQDARKDLEKNAVLYKILAAAAERNGDAENSSEMMKRYHAIVSVPDRQPSAAPAPPPEATVAAAPALTTASGEVETMPLDIPGEPAEVPLQEAALEMPGEDVDICPSALPVAAFCKFLEQYTRKPPLTLPEPVFFSREDREALKKILQCRTATLS
jgi:tetratricopeptide (TPR) repeat protein